MRRGHGFGLCSRDGTLTSPAIIYPIGSLVLDTWMLGTGSPELAKSALSFLLRVDCELTLGPAATCFRGVESSLGRPLGCSDPSTPACYYLLLPRLPVLPVILLSCLLNILRNALS